MSTRAAASAVFPLPLETVWKSIRDFTAVPKHFPSVDSVELEGEGAGPTSVGSVRKITWKTGEVRRQQLLELSDQYFSISWETVSANHETEASAAISSIKLYRVTEDNSTLVSWSTDFAADVTAKTVALEQKSYLQNLKDLRDALTK